VKTAKDLFAEICCIEQLLDIIKLAKNRAVGSGRSLHPKRGCSIGSTGSVSGDRI
jgi:hypothetical protein